MSTEERRAPGAARFPFEALVEVGGALGPTFEAQAVNVSEEGIQLRTAYLPEPGQPLTCRFDAGAGSSVLACGEVAWSRGGDRGGEFGVRFTDVDAESLEALKRACGMIAPAPSANIGSKVRLHIDGLASPMRAKIKDAQAAAVTVGSDLGFLQVGRPLELEDAESGTKRPASIDRVEVAVDPGSHVPQLIVTLRYTDEDGAVSAPRFDSKPGRAPGANDVSRMSASADAAHAGRRDPPPPDLRGGIARSIERLGPALGRLVDQVKTTAAVLARRRGAGDDGAMPRRTTAPPPGGGLHAAGRRVVRGDRAAATPDEAPLPARLGMTPRRAAVVGGVMTAAIVGALALKHAHREPPSAATATDSVATPAAVGAPASAGALASAAPPPITAPAAGPSPVAASTNTGQPATASPSQPLAESDDSAESKAAHKHRVHVAPFGNGPVHHGNVLRLKMDGPIEAIEGAQQPTGFEVKIPGRRSLEAAAPLAARDGRIAGIKVSNDTAGAELTVTFKDGVPNYQVSARGDMLVISLAPMGALDRSVADKDEKGGRSAKHAKRAHAHGQETL